jgi:restriction system protein
MDLASLMPWWAGVALALVSYLVLHRLAQPSTVPLANPRDLSGMMTRSVLLGLASVGQYVLPILLLGGACISAINRRNRSALVHDVVARGNAADALDGMSWREFELLVGEAFRLSGYTVAETGCGGADGGVDLVLRKGSDKFLVQCKQWKALKVPVQPVRELYGVMAARGAAGGFVVTSGRFTEDAVAFASGGKLTLIDGPQLLEMLHKAQASLKSKGQAATAKMASATPPVAPLIKPEGSRLAASGVESAPLCPVCSRGMLLRKARRGPNAGGTFWGCAGYPDCKGTRTAAA